MTSFLFGTAEPSSSYSTTEEDLQLDANYNNRPKEMWKSNWQILTDTTCGAEFWWNEETKERSYLPPALQKVKVLESVADMGPPEDNIPAWFCLKCRFQNDVQQEHCQMCFSAPPASEVKEDEILFMGKDKVSFEVKDSYKIDEDLGNPGDVFLEVADLILDDFNGIVKDDHKSNLAEEAELDIAVEPEAIIIKESRDEKLSLDNELERGSTKGRYQSITKNRALVFSKGVYIQIFFNETWVPGVIIDTSPGVYVEVIFVFDGENFRKKLIWASAYKKLRAVPELVHGTWSLSKEDILSRLEKFRLDNSVCADCTGVPEWAELCHGVIICSKCSGVHRNLGVHISKVRSLTLDMWTEQMYRSLRGNIIVNEELEYCVPPEYPKPHCDSHVDVRETFIRAKYEKKLFQKQPNVNPLPAVYDIPKVEQRFESSGKAYGSSPTVDVNAKPQKSLLAAKARVQYDGFLIIQCFEAKDLPALAHIPRGKPNPYCVFLNGSHQKGRTRVCEKTKNPHFNSVVHINVQEKEPLIVLVFDSCRMGKDMLLCSGKLDIIAELEADKEKTVRLPLDLTPRFKAKYEKKKKKKFPVIHFQVAYSRLV